MPKTPQQNDHDVTKRKNRTILKMAINMLKTKKMSREFWTEDVTCAAYLTNRAPINSVHDKTPSRSMEWKKVRN